MAAAAYATTLVSSKPTELRAAKLQLYLAHTPIPVVARPLGVAATLASKSVYFALGQNVVVLRR